MRQATIHTCVSCLCCALACTRASAQVELLVSSRLTNSVLKYDAAGNSTGRFDHGADILSPNGVVLGPDGFVYLSSRNTNQVMRYRLDGTFDRVFASGPEMVAPSGLTFGPGGDLYVANSLANNIGRYDATTGALVRTFGSSAELNSPIGVAFGPDGHAYVTSALNNRLIRYNGQSFDFDQVVVEGGLLSNPADIQRAPDGLLYIASVLQNRVARFNTSNGSIENFVQSAFLQTPVAVAFHEGDVFVASFNGDKVVRVDGTSAAIEGNFVQPGAGGLDGPQYLAFIPEPGGVLLLALPLVGLRHGIARARARAHDTT
jgi:streptogramin lyase